jgi:formylglycine-generating enzyme required for sulfatase activity
MRSQLSRGLWLVVFLTPALVGLLRGGQVKTTPDDPIASLVRKLGSNVFSIREEASRKLIEMGEKAVPALQKAASENPDLETQRRAEALIKAIVPKTRKSKIGLELAFIEGGELRMGSPPAERNRRADEDMHSVWLKGGFYLGIHEVTQEQYETVHGRNPSWFTNAGFGRDKVFGMDTSRFPVENVTWYDAIEFCNRLSQRDDLPPYYKLADVKRDGITMRNAKVTILGGNGYRLPTEAEWEFACRAFTEGPYHFNRTPTGREANFKSSVVTGGYGAGQLWQPLNRTEKVGSYPANAFGLCDMHGNVAEWCWDFYAAYTETPRVNPDGAKLGTQRVLRGGAWLLPEVSCRSASRSMQAPGEYSYNVGFRLARNP